MVDRRAKVGVYSAPPRDIVHFFLLFSFILDELHLRRIKLELN